MTWTLEEIEHEWFDGEHLALPAEDVLRAFDAAEKARGREWVRSTTELFGGGRQWGFGPFLRVYGFGKRIQAVAGAPGSDMLLERLRQNDRAAETELTAIYLLRSRRPATELEIGPRITVGDRQRQPDFRIRDPSAPWTYVEVTQLNESSASAQTHKLLDGIAAQVMSVVQPFLLEIVLWRDPTDGEEENLIREAHAACEAASGQRLDISDLASLIVKSGHPAVVVPSVLLEDNRPRMALARSIVGPGEVNRQIIVRIPFADQRAEDILSAEARQLPKNESGLVMVDVTAQPGAFESWPELVPRRFSPSQHTRVGGVLLFMTAVRLTPEGLASLPDMKLLTNPHARKPLPDWILEVVEETRAECRRLTGRPD